MKTTKFLLSLSLIASFLGISQLSSVEAAEIHPMFTYGESLNQTQLQQTKTSLGVQDGTENILIRINELNDLLNDNYPYNQVYSSTYITPRNNNGAVTVEIMTPKTITAITPSQYENAAITAGATDVDIKVASAVPVDGSGALAGVYKAFKASGQPLNQQAVSVAQNELATTSDIAQRNNDKEGFSDQKLSQAVADIKQQITEKKAENNGQITNNDIQVIINNVINNYNLNNILSQEDIQQLNRLMQQFSQIELTDAQKNALKNIGDTLKKNGEDLLNKAKNVADSITPEQKQELNNWWDQFVAWLKGLLARLGL